MKPIGNAGVKRGRGRPAMPLEKKRSARLMLRVTEEERDRILAAAECRNTTVTDLLIGPWRTGKDNT